jgi:hypothetical protein
MVVAQESNFWLAYRLLNFNKANLIKLGIELAKRVQSSLVSQGCSIIEKKEVKFHQAFRYVILNQDNLKDEKFFSHPLAL